MTVEEHERILEEKLRICYDHALELGFKNGFEIGKEVGKEEGFRDRDRAIIFCEERLANIKADMETKRRMVKDFLTPFPLKED